VLHHWQTLTCIPHCVRCRFLSLISSFASFPWRSYFVAPDKKQATLRGAEHRRAMHFLPFAVSAILGAATGQWNHSVITWAMCELAALVRDLFAPECVGGGVNVGRARQLTARLTTWMHRDFQGLFGPLHTPKLHRLLAHVFDELRLRGSLLAGDTGVNEAKHKGVKAAYARTNRGRADHALQLLMAEQVADVLSWASMEENGGNNESIADNNDAASSAPEAVASPAAVVAAPGVAVDTASPRLLRHGRSVRVGTLAAERSIEGLAQCLELSNNDILTVPVGTFLARGAALRRGGDRRQIVRACNDYYGAPWYDWVEYNTIDGRRRVGRARVVISGVGKRAVRLLVVERACVAPAVSGCPFAAYKCTRLRFDTRDAGVTPTLECVPVSRVLRVLCVEHDWVDWVRRHGLEVMPTLVPTTREEVANARFFVNVFLNL